MNRMILILTWSEYLTVLLTPEMSAEIAILLRHRWAHKGMQISRTPHLSVVLCLLKFHFTTFDIKFN